MAGLLALSGLLGAPLLLLLVAGTLERHGRGGRLTPFALRRLAWVPLTVWLVFTASFFLMRATPGGPFDDGRRLPERVKLQLEARFGLDRPLTEQYLAAVDGLVRMDFGPSLVLRDHTVGTVVAEGLPVSILLGGAALFFATFVGLPLGLFAALRRGTAYDHGLTALAVLGMTLPNFVIASLLLIPFAFVWKLLPPAGLDGPTSFILPTICLGLPFAAQIARLARTGLLEVLDADHVRTARAKGLSERRVLFAHALPGAILPVVSWMGPVAAGVLTGSLVVERVFALPGLGTHFVESALGRDYTLALGLVTVFTLAVALMNFVADLLVALLDPRVRPA